MPKKGLDFFPLDTVLDTKFQLIEAEFGLKGFAVVVKLLQKIYQEEGYYCEWKDDVRLLFSQSIGEGYSLVSEIVETSVRRGIFDSGMYGRFRILTSAGIQKRYFEATSRRSSVEVKKDYLLVSHTQTPKNVNILSGNVNKNAKNVDRKSQSKESKESKESKVEDAPAELSAAVAEVVSFYQKNMGVPVGSLIMEKLLAWMDDVDTSLIKYAIEQAVTQNVKTWAYVEAILKNHFNAGRKTRAEAEGSKGKGSNAKPTKFSNFDGRDFDYDAFESTSIGKGDKNGS